MVFRTSKESEIHLALLIHESNRALNEDSRATEIWENFSGEELNEVEKDLSSFLYFSYSLYIKV